MAAAAAAAAIIENQRYEMAKISISNKQAAWRRSVWRQRLAHCGITTRASRLAQNRHKRCAALRAIALLARTHSSRGALIFVRACLRFAPRLAA